jgi:hypothetical protein
MNADKIAAEERLFEASLQSLLGRAAAAPRSAPRPSAWMMAAILMLGLCVVGATMWLQRAAGAVTAPAQDSDVPPLPKPVEGKPTTLATLPADTQNLYAGISSPSHLALLKRFGHLRRLQIGATDPLAGDPNGTPRWRSQEVQDDAEVLAALVDLPSLEVLELPASLVLRPANLGPLLRLPKLRELHFSGGADCGAAKGRALCELPAVRVLNLFATKVDAAFFEALAGRPVRRLVLTACPGLDADAWRAIGHLRALHHLEVTHLNNSTMEIGGTKWRLGVLDPAAPDALAALPNLRELVLSQTGIDDDLLVRMPVRLECLDLGDQPSKPAAVLTLRRLRNLRELTFGHELDPAAAIELLGTLRLTRLDYRGKEVTPALLRAIAAQPDLTELSLLVRSPHIDFAQLAKAPRLESLQLLGSRGYQAELERLESVDELLPLRECNSLRDVRLINCGLDRDAVNVLGPGITVTVTEYL